MRVPKASTPITAKQIALLHVAKRQLGLTDSVVRAMIQTITDGKKESTAHLGQGEFTVLMNVFIKNGFVPHRPSKSYGYRPTMATPAQVDLIRSLWSKFLGRDDENDVELSKWLDRFHKVSSLRFVNSKKAAKVISALRNMNSRKQDQN